MKSFPFGTGAAIFIALYFSLMLGLGFVARRFRKNESPSEFYLAGKTLGGFVLLLTLYATQYSGNTLLGYPGEAYRLGFARIMSVGFMMSIVVVYLLFAPGLHQLAKQYDFITPGDWIQHRFGMAQLTLVVNLLLVVAIANFLLAQLMAMGHVVAGLTGNAVPYWMGVVFLALIIIIYETLGGMRAVAWTDCIQGIMLIVGLGGLLFVALQTTERLQDVTAWIIEHEPQKAAVPSWEICRTWISTILLVGFSGAVYPQAIQRIYAARNTRTLKRSLSLMIFMPLVTTLVVFLIGIIAIQQFAHLEGIAADQVMPLLLNEWANQSLMTYAMAVLVVTGILAAIMSTADSVLLSLSSMLAKDFLGRTVLKEAKEERLTKAGKILSWVIMAVLVPIALVPRLTLWGLTELKMELLSQTAPVIILGVVWRRLSGQAALIGVVAGTTLALILTFWGYGKLWGFHAGLLGLGLNVGCCISLTLLNRKLP